MKRFAFSLLLLAVVVTTVSAQDIREARRQAEADREQALVEAAAIEQRILADRDRLTAVVDSLEARQLALETELRDLTSGQTEATRCRDTLQEEWSNEERVAAPGGLGLVMGAVVGLVADGHGKPLAWAPSPGRVTVLRCVPRGPGCRTS